MLAKIQPRHHELLDIAAVIATLIAINLTAHFTPLSAAAATVPVGVAMLLGYAKLRGMTWQDLGLSRGDARSGLRWGLGMAGVAAVVVAIALALPATRGFFFNESYASLRHAAIAALIIIPAQTVLPEELAFRGILHGSLLRLGGTKLVFVAGSVLFGLWHIASSLHLTATNAGLTAFLGSGSFAQWAGVGLAVMATTAAGAGLTWLRHHTGSVLAPIGLHWALNAVGAVAAAIAWQIL
ncbi:MAG TPA: CPBP family intramembrane metalloprotease [Candidatus Corynebacterium gallistercoris]|uniref:CPBP family intramembrane metalloprotease n=1 Tax=Candidatus Corynebacterium gallistercoris TaxID=2838530 RepID=A0A9D1RYC9_9CORY|nr:CPBP family intramembrane metalloprotease [Candidatus Corynebacterium gallistercoris]